MNTDYNRQSQGSFDNPANKLILSYDPQNHVLTLTTDEGIKKEFRVKFMKNGQEGLSFTPQQKCAIGQIVANLITSKLDKTSQESLGCLIITKEGMKTEEWAPGSAINLSFSKEDAATISNLFSGKIPATVAMAQPLDANRVTVEGPRRESLLVSFFKDALEKISYAFSNLVGFFTRKEDVEIDLEEVIPSETNSDEGIPDLLEEEFLKDRQIREDEVNAISDEELGGAFLTEGQGLRKQDGKVKFDAEKAFDDLIDRDEIDLETSQQESFNDQLPNLHEDRQIREDVINSIVDEEDDGEKERLEKQNGEAKFDAEKTLDELIDKFNDFTDKDE